MLARFVIAVLLLAGLAGCAPAHIPLTLAQPDPAAEYAVSLPILDDGSGPRMCPVLLTSDPPQCRGLPVRGMSWENVPNVSESAGVRWADLSLVGTFDGQALTLTAPPQPAVPQPASPGVAIDEGPGRLTDNEVNHILNVMRTDLPGLLLGSGPGDGFVSVTVWFDDGSLQRQVDARFGAGAVRVVSMLLPA